jgi:uncharacterized membrane protein
MDDAIGLIIGLLVLVALLALIVMPIIALVVSIRSRKKINQAISRFESTQSTVPGSAPTSLSGVLQQLTIRVARLEAAIPPKSGSAPERVELAKPTAEPGTGPQAFPPRAAPPLVPAPARPPVATSPPTPVAQPIPPRAKQAERLESIIGRRWLGWVSVALILFATAFFLKYAFDNRWIGELGRVTIGVATGITLTALGFRYHQRKWRIFSQILTGGGVVLLYLTAYASFGYYHLATQKAAFVYVAILIAEAAGLALLYEAPAIAVMALIGGFLAPVLLHSDRDQYRSFFSYIAGLDIGALALLKHWWGLSSLAFVGTHVLFWLWYVDHYHPRKLGAVMAFQTVVFLAFFIAHFARRLVRREQVVFEDPGLLIGNPAKFFVTFEELSLLLINPFAFFATAYFFLNPNHHDWMGVFAIGMALLYAGAAKLLLDRRAATRTELLLMIGAALTFVTLAIPIQLKSNWITMAWAVEGLVLLWTGIETKSKIIRGAPHVLFALALIRLVFWDTPFGYRPMFTPVLNKYFLSSLFVTGCLFAAAFIYRKLGADKEISARVLQITIVIVAIVALWFVTTVETQTFFAARAALRKGVEDIRHEHWLGQMALSVLWSIYAATLMAVGFIRRASAIRWAALSLFALTVIKVMLVDIAVLKQLYRIMAFLVLGLLLLVVTWGYHRAFHSKES